MIMSTWQEIMSLDQKMMSNCQILKLKVWLWQLEAITRYKTGYSATSCDDFFWQVDIIHKTYITWFRGWHTRISAPRCHESLGALCHPMLLNFVSHDFECEMPYYLPQADMKALARCYWMPKAHIFLCASEDYFHSVVMVRFTKATEWQDLLLGVKCMLVILHSACQEVHIIANFDDQSVHDFFFLLSSDDSWSSMRSFYI